ncbi:GNAT family N-acetyltransferase [Brachybacterium halotolerans subsp. kimchii]|uniref:GNAT family N-acetyltransferase n=1 Tax=Brachybacterium halotolerans TaxID=2795215 RepID=UPI001E52E422|nr:GNAT family N-acetyltransferase [Brachybacterium halotolerans]UEJ82002.1 GNAT family N-acetyltransferase [Brachybacterium halotolerans subsp. kimchii]
MTAPLTRLATPADRDIVRTLRLRTLQEDPEAFGSTYEGTLEREREDPTFWDRFLALGACILATPEGGEVPRGIARVVPATEPGEPAMIFSVWVASEARGTGTGRALIDACIDWAEEHLPGVRLRLHVMRENPAARRLYERCGFGEIGADPEDPGQLVMERRSGRALPAVLLPTALVARYRAVDREIVGSPHLDTPTHLDAIEADARVRGIRTPLDLAFNEQFATLDGNHRVAVALRLGLAQVPVHVTRRLLSPRPEHARPMRPEDLAVLEEALASVQPD